MKNNYYNWTFSSDLTNPYTQQVALRYAQIGGAIGAVVGFIPKSTIILIIEQIVGFFFVLVFTLSRYFLLLGPVGLIVAIITIAVNGLYKKLMMVLLPVFAVFTVIGFSINMEQFTTTIVATLTPVLQFAVRALSLPADYICGSLLLDTALGIMISMGIFYRKKTQFDALIKSRQEKVHGRDYIESNRA